MRNISGKDIDWTSQYAAIGEFVVNFESILDKVRFECSAIFQIRGLKGWGLSEIVFGQKLFTAYPLIICFESLVNEVLKEQPNVEPLLIEVADFKNKFKALIEKRNDYLHSFYPIGKDVNFLTTTDVEPDHIIAFKNSPNKKGARKKQVVESLDQLSESISELKELMEQFKKLRGKLHQTLWDNDLDEIGKK